MIAATAQPQETSTLTADAAVTNKTVSLAATDYGRDPIVGTFAGSTQYSLTVARNVPGLGQVIQGRIAKGFLFFIALYGLFFYGMAMGHWKNVWLPQPDEVPAVDIFGYKLEGTARTLAHRREYLGQFWMGAAAWPALVQYVNFDKSKETGPIFGSFQRCPPEEVLNQLQRDGNKRWDLGWVFTVIAGVLNLLIIYDALAGPMFRDDEESQSSPAPAGGTKS